MRTDISLQEQKYEKLIQEKEETIAGLNAIISNHEKVIKVEPGKLINVKVNTMDEIKVDRIFEQLKKEHKLDYFKSDFKRYHSDIINQQGMDDEDSKLREFVAMGLFTKGAAVGYGGHHYTYHLTKVGAELKDKLFFS